MTSSVEKKAELGGDTSRLHDPRHPIPATWEDSAEGFLYGQLHSANKYLGYLRQPSRRGYFECPPSLASPRPKGRSASPPHPCQGSTKALWGWECHGQCRQSHPAARSCTSVRRLTWKCPRFTWCPGTGSGVNV